MKNNHVQWRVFTSRNGFKFPTRHWFMHHLNIKLLIYDIRDAYQRMKRGWGDGDIFDLVSYHAGVTLGLLKHFKENHNGYCGESQEEYESKLDLAIDAWQAKYDLVMDIGWEKDEESYREWRDALEARWVKGYPAFIEIYDSLWN